LKKTQYEVRNKQYVIRNTQYERNAKTTKNDPQIAQMNAEQEGLDDREDAKTRRGRVGRTEPEASWAPRMWSNEVAIIEGRMMARRAFRILETQMGRREEF
jgi:hypothetical protein